MSDTWIELPTTTGFCEDGEHHLCLHRSYCPCSCHNNTEKETPIMTEVEVFEDEPLQGEIVEVAEPLTKRAAQALDKKIRAASDKLSNNVNQFYELLEQASQGRIWAVLEYSSWTAWFADAVQFTPSDRIERKELVKLMNGKGMSQRGIAGTLGVSQKTVDRDLEGVVESSDSTTVTTTEGKTYPKHPKQKITDPEPEAAEPPLDVDETEVIEEEPEPTVSTPATVAKEFGAEMDNLLVDTQALVDVVADDVWAKARNRVGKKHLNDLQGVITTLSEIVDDLMSV